MLPLKIGEEFAGRSRVPCLGLCQTLPDRDEVLHLAYSIQERLVRPGILNHDFR
jgi:hypothetical protein